MVVLDLVPGLVEPTLVVITVVFGEGGLQKGGRRPQEVSAYPTSPQSQSRDASPQRSEPPALLVSFSWPGRRHGDDGERQPEEQSCGSDG